MDRIPRLAPFVFLLALHGCAGLGSGGNGTDSQGAVQPAAPAAETPQAGARSAPVRDLRWIIDRLQDGQLVEGREALVGYLRREPGNPTARSLLQQIDTDPVALLGRNYTTYTLRPGETLGEIAGRHLGDPLRFVALARYNGIERARSVVAGQSLKIPAGRGGLAASAPPPAAEADVVPAEERAEQFQKRIEAELAAGRIDSANAAIEQARAESPGGSGWNGWLDPLARRARALAFQQRGLAQLDRRQHEAAYDSLGQALALEPDLQPAARQRQAVRGKLVAEYHEAAVVRYRNQQLDEAIALWDKALKLDPGFEPARGYRTRALELKRRLQALGAAGNG